MKRVKRLLKIPFRALRRFWRRNIARNQESISVVVPLKAEQEERNSERQLSETETLLPDTDSQAEDSSKPHPLGYLGALPLEVILCITDQLHPAPLVSLAQTCRFYYHFLARKRPLLNTLERRNDYLQSVEENTEDTYFCYSCQKLHMQSQVLHRLLHSVGLAEMKPPCIWADCMFGAFKVPMGPFGFLDGSGVAMLSMTEARLIMNNHFYGPSRGLDLSYLHSSGRRKVGVRSMEIVSYEPKIIGHELFLHSFLSYSQWGENRTALRRFVHRERRRRFCAHTFIDSLYCGQFYRKRWYPDPGRVPWFAMSCQLCLTDYTIRLRYDRPGAAFVFDVHVFQQLGSCRSPRDWKWACFTRFAQHHDGGRSDFHAAGSVRRRWLAHNGGNKEGEEEDGEEEVEEVVYLDIFFGEHPSPAKGFLQTPRNIRWRDSLRDDDLTKVGTVLEEEID